MKTLKITLIAFIYFLGLFLMKELFNFELAVLLGLAFALMMLSIKEE